MNGDAAGEAPRPRPLSAGIWTLFSWLRRADRSSSSDSVSSAGSDRTVASFDFLAPRHYNRAGTPLALPQHPLTETYKKRLHERNLRRQHDRDITLRRKYGLFREEGLGYDASSLPAARRSQDSVPRPDRARRAASESVHRRSAYVPGKRRAPLPPAAVVSATLPRNYKRKRPAPKPPVISEENKENVEIAKIIQMNSTSDVGESFLSKDVNPVNKTEKHSKPETKEVKLRADKSFLKQMFDNKKRNSAIDTSRIKLLPSISELDKQAAEIIEANKALRASGHKDSSYIDSGFRSASADESWICTTCLKKYKPVVTCCIYCIIKENSNNKTGKNVSANASNIYTQTYESAPKSSGKGGLDDKKKLREMLKEMKDSLPKRPKHNDENSGHNRDGIVKPTETPTLRIGSTVDENTKVSFNDSKILENERGPKNLKNNAKELFLTSQPSSSKESHIEFVTTKVELINRKSDFESPLPNFINSGNSFHEVSKSIVVKSETESLDSNKQLLRTKNIEIQPSNTKIKQTKNVLSGDDIKITNEIDKSPELGNINKCESSSPKYVTKITNELLDNNVKLNVNKDQTLKEFDGNSSKDSPANSEKDALTKIPAHIKVLKINNANQPSVLPNKKSECSNSRIKDKIELIQLGNVYSSKIVNKDQIEPAITSNNSKIINLHTPLKISSLLNPLYCPKYITSNDKVADCNFAKVLTKKVEDNKKEKTSLNEQKLIPNITAASTSINVQTPSASNPKLLNESLQKSEANPTEGSIVIKSENASALGEDPERKIGENASSEVKTSPSSVKILDHHDRRRNLINQLEQAISKGDEQLAAEAAAKLAKLKLACSVLSFSSQIVAENIASKTEVVRNISNEENKTKNRMNQASASSGKHVNEVYQQEIQNATTRKVINVLPEAIASTSSEMLDEELPIEVWVEDKEAARGPIPLRISRKARIGELKRHVETTLGLEIRLQRWIVGRTLCTDDNIPLVALAGPDLDAPFYLCLVESEPNKNTSPQIEDVTHAQIKTEPSGINNAGSGDVYTELMKLEQQALVPNTEEFECGVCMERCVVGAGAVLRECIHMFCKECLADVIRHCEEPVVPCPAIQCPGAIQEREIRAVLSAEEYERWLARGLAAAESGTRNTFHCRTRDCTGWAFCEPGVWRFPCPVCEHTNCVPCQAVHEGDTCEQYQVKVREAVSAAESNQTDEGTQALLKSLISRGEALECPECSAIITKKWGCDWVKCSACKTEICWVTRGRRWGPGGKGDTSAGCRCGVDGKRCHPSCGYCH